MSVFLIVMSFVIPLTLLILGVVYRTHYPKSINDRSGYRTTRSKQSLDAWIFAQKAFSKVSIQLGIVELVITCIFVYFNMNQNAETLSWYVNGFAFVQILIMLLVIPIVEKKLKKEFE